MKQYFADSHVTCRVEEPEGALLYRPDIDSLQIINMTGLMIWEAVQTPHTLDEILEELLTRGLDVSRDVLEKDVMVFIDEMIRSGHVRVSGDEVNNG
ncbi:MAG TPA: PqqD family protein [bacterium]|nr:PqqD family protein [bacterium]